MQIAEGKMNPDSSRTAVDRHAVTAAGQMLMSAIWLEHRVRRFSTRLSVLPSGHASSTSSGARQGDAGMLRPGGRATAALLIERRARVTQ